MKFQDLFREAYRKALRAAREKDKAGVDAGLAALCQLFKDQYNKQNRDSIVTKAQLSGWYEAFATYLRIVREQGLEDRRVQKLFGLIEDDSAPSFSDVMGGAATPRTAPPAPETASGSSSQGGSDGESGGINMDGILPVVPETPAASEPSGVEGSAAEDEPSEQRDPVPDAEDAAENKPVAPAENEGETAGGNANGGTPSFKPESLRDFIGQAHIVKALLKEIAIAKNKGIQHLDNILLFGNPGLGKSTLMRLIAKELGVRFELLDCSQFRNSQQSLKALQAFFMRIARENSPVVIALDEVHMLTEELQSSLLTLLNDRVYVSPLDVNGNNVRIPIDEFTFIAATTDDDEVLETIKNRCLRLRFQLVDYTPEELQQIYRNKLAAKGLTADEDAILACIPRSRGAIRYVESIVDGLDSALYDDAGNRRSTHVDLDVALAYFKERGIDEIGLEAKDLEILRELANATAGTLSADVLSARVGLTTKKYMSEYERYLIKIGFILVSGRGRSLSEKAIKHLKGEENNDAE